MGNKGEFKEVSNEIIGWENNKIWRTIRDLTIRPGMAITEYCEGQKEKYLSPVTYYFATVAISFYLSMVTGMTDDLLKYSQEQIKQQMKSIEAYRPLNTERLAEHNIFLEFVTGETGQKLLILPLALLLRWLLFKRHNKSFKSNTWYSLFTMGHESIVTGPFMVLIWYLTNSFTLSIFFALATGLFYDSWTSFQFYKVKLSTSIALNLLFTLIYLLMLSIVVELIGAIVLLR